MILCLMGMGIARDYGATMQYDEWTWTFLCNIPARNKGNEIMKSLHEELFFFFSLVPSKNYDSQSTVFAIVSFSDMYSL